jgi:CheY-like chemotaxis protein
MAHRPIIIVEDDLDDQFMISKAFKGIECANEVKFFNNGHEAYEYLINDPGSPFLIISDINMPKVNGLELRDKICKNEALMQKTIPFVFFTTSATKETVCRAYHAAAQGFFIKPDNLDAFQKLLHRVIEYWQSSVTPDEYM